MTTRQIETHLNASKNSSCLPLLRDHREIQLLPLRSLKAATKNTRTHRKKQIQQIASSIVQFGWTYPILIDEERRIICGHGRWEAAKELRLKKVPVLVITGLSDVAKRALAIADNKIAANAGWDRDLLAAELGELVHLLPECNLDLEITGFEPAEIDGLMAELGDEVDPSDEPAKIAVNPVSRKGDIWELGGHRLLCGDACDQADWGRLMGRDRAAMVFADPPYNVRLSPWLGHGKTKYREFAQASGEMSPAEFVEFLTRWMRHLAKFSEVGSIHFACIDWRHIGEMLEAGGSVFGPLQNLVVWNKTNAGQGSFYRSQHELICVFKNGNAPHLNNIELGRHGRNRSNVWTYAGVNTFRNGRLDDLSVHPTVKPVALVADAIKDFGSFWQRGRLRRPRSGPAARSRLAAPERAGIPSLRPGRTEHFVIERPSNERQDCSQIHSTSASIGAVLRLAQGGSCEYRDHA